MVPCADDELVEVRVLLEADERAHAVARELGRRGDDLVDDARLLLRAQCRAKNAREPTRMSPRRMSFWKTTTTMRMIDESSVESRLNSVTSPSPLRDDVDEEDDAEAGAHLHRARAAEHEQRAVDDVGDDEDVDRVDEDLERTAAREEVAEALEHQRPPLSGRVPERRSSMSMA